MPDGRFGSRGCETVAVGAQDEGEGARVAAAEDVAGRQVVLAGPRTGAATRAGALDRAAQGIGPRLSWLTPLASRVLETLA